MTKGAFTFKSQETEKIKLVSQETDNSINLRYDNPITVDYKFTDIPVLLSWM